MSKRIPSLDGLRAVSISLVLLCHANGSRGFGYLPSFLGDIGALGVRVFFVISGFLITHLLLKEKESAGRIGLANFYRRRAFRILPVAFAYVAVVLVLGEHPANATPALTFTANYLPTTWNLAHFWSLSVEEQFYLLWPVAVLLLRRRAALVVLISAMVLCPVFRVIHYAAQPGAGWNHFELVADALAFGSLLACVRTRLLQSILYKRLMSSRAVALIAVVAALSANAAGNHPRFFWGVGVTACIVAIGVLMEHCILHPPYLLNNRPVVWFGTLSYSLYVWQELFLRQFRPGWWPNAFPWSILLALSAAMVSFYLIERPILRLRDRFSFGFVRTRHFQKEAPVTA